MLQLKNNKQIKLTAILANIDGVIGIENAVTKEQKLAWKHCKGDMKFFRETTEFSVVIMGNNTLKSMGGNPLKNRINIVLTNDINLIESSKHIEITFEDEPQIKYVNKELLIDVLTEIYSYDTIVETVECFIIGGKQIYDLFYTQIDTWIKSDIPLNYMLELGENERYIDMHETFDEILKSYDLTTKLERYNKDKNEWYLFSYYERL